MGFEVIPRHLHPRKGSLYTNSEAWRHLRPAFAYSRSESGTSYWGTFQLLVSSGWDRVQLRLDHLLHFPNPNQVRHSVAFCLLVKNLLTIQIHFEPAIGAGGERDSGISAVAAEKLVRHPRGGRVIFSSDAVHDIH